MSYQIPAIPRGTARLITATCWLFENARAIGIAVVCIALLLVAAGVARANCGSIPDRKEALCDALGHRRSPCRIQWETNEDGSFKGLYGELTLVSDTNVDEPLTGADELRTSTLMRFRTPIVDIKKTFGVTAPDFNGLAKSASDPPCLTPRCTVNQSLIGLDDYKGVDEFEMIDVINVGKKLLWQPPDERIVEKLREAYDAVGLPIATFAWNPRLDDESETELASTLKFNVIWLFALPAK